MRIFDSLLTDKLFIYFGPAVLECRLVSPNEALKHHEHKDGWHAANPGELWKWYEQASDEERESACLIIGLGRVFPHGSNPEFDRIAALYPGNMLTTCFASVHWTTMTRALEVHDYDIDESAARELLAA